MNAPPQQTNQRGGFENHREDMIVDIFITGRCDMDCPFCYGAEVPIFMEEASAGDSRLKVPMYRATEETTEVTGTNEARPELSMDELKVLLVKLKNIGIKRINVGGGEPLLRKDTPEVLRFAHEIGLEVYLSTNATFTQFRYEEIKDSITVMGLPLDGSTVDMNVTMGRKFYLIPNLRKLLVYLHDNPPTHKVKVGTVVSKKNIDDIINIGRMLFRTEGIYKPDVWRIYQFEAVERGEENRADYEITTDEFDEVIARLRGEFPDVNISPRANSQHSNAYFFVSPDGMLQLVDNKHRSVMDLRDANEAQISSTIDGFSDTVDKTVANRKWLVES